MSTFIVILTKIKYIFLFVTLNTWYDSAKHYKIHQRGHLIVLCVTANKGLMDHILPMLPCSSFFINEMSSLMSRVRSSTVMPYICGNVYENVLHFGQNHYRRRHFGYICGPLRTDTTREFFFKRKLINYTKNELQGINILKLRLPNGFKCCLNFFIVGMGTNVK